MKTQSGKRATVHFYYLISRARIQDGFFVWREWGIRWLHHGDEVLNFGVSECFPKPEPIWDFGNCMGFLIPVKIYLI